MAAGIINLQKASGGITKISSVDGIGITEVMLPESGELVNKAYADLKVALADFTGTNVNLASTGYQKLPSGLIIQWGSALQSAGVATYNFPLAFPSYSGNLVCSFKDYTATDGYTVQGMGLSSSEFKIKHNYPGGNIRIAWITIGY